MQTIGVETLLSHRRRGVLLVQPRPAAVAADLVTDVDPDQLSAQLRALAEQLLRRLGAEGEAIDDRAAAVQVVAVQVFVGGAGLAAAHQLRGDVEGDLRALESLGPAGERLGVGDRNDDSDAALVGLLHRDLADRRQAAAVELGALGERRRCERAERQGAERGGEQGTVEQRGRLASGLEVSWPEGRTTSLIDSGGSTLERRPPAGEGMDEPCLRV
jgi:hypothetical protein